jgi:hypothetical protein
MTLNIPILMLKTPRIRLILSLVERSRRKRGVWDSMPCIVSKAEDITEDLGVFTHFWRLIEEYGLWRPLKRVYSFLLLGFS